MFDHLQIYNARERLLVGVADALLGVATAATHRVRRTPWPHPKNILVLRLERIGDLLMALDALDAVRRRAPDAHIHLVVGSWNAALAPLLPAVDSWETLDVPWLARGGRRDSTAALVQRARGWRARGFDLALNLEPDIRSNMLLALSGAPRRAGFRSAGGGDLLTDAHDFAPHLHTRDNLTRLVDAVLPPTDQSAPLDATGVRLRIPDAARREARRLLDSIAGRPTVVGLHASGGRPIKQWPLDRFAAVGARLGRERAATIVLTGTTDDRPQVERVAALLPADVQVVDVAGTVDLSISAAVVEQLTLLVTGDTGPMHLAAAVGTPVVAIFGPSDPGRYGPLTDRARVLTADLWCRPCNRVRRPPARCAAGLPDCLRLVTVEQVVQAAGELLDATAQLR